MKKLLLLLLLTPLANYSQIATTNSAPFNSEEFLVTNILLDNSVNSSNFSAIGLSDGIGYFDGFNANIGFEEGIILSTGGLSFVTDGLFNGSGVSGDDDLEAALSTVGMAGYSVNNVTVLEFDFIANSENIEFNYVFGSMEYTSYTCSQFNDIFGFFLSGPGIAGPYTNNAVNIALVPDPEGAVDYNDWLANNTGLYTNTPVAINTINNGEMTNDPNCNSIDPNFEDYNIFWYDNDYGDIEGVNQPPDPEFTVEGLTGFTTPLKAVYNGLTCGETYHIKLAIADCADGILNSAVFLEKNSFFSHTPITINTISGINSEFSDTVIVEGCESTEIEFSVFGNGETDILLEVNTAMGSAEYGIDYEINYEDGSSLDQCINNSGEQSSCIIIPATYGIGSVSVYLTGSDDFLNEGTENIILNINAIDGVCEPSLFNSEMVFSLSDFSILEEAGYNCNNIGITNIGYLKTLLRKIDLFGRETINNKGLQLHIYDDGSVEQKYLIK